MDIHPNRLGKYAILAAISSREEEDEFKAYIAEKTRLKIGVTFVSGIQSEVTKSFVRSLVTCALHSHVVHHQHNEIHAVIHAGLECLKGVTSDVAAESSLKLKVAIVSDGRWIVIAAHGESAFHPETNHERMGFGVMHI
ncbi:transcriptional regulator [Roseospira marina]|uniref:Hut operon positive regulatory protein n=1 Tax=Roseospira marina TaxID=140057 RepID=A0A5M6IED6_9PROT|nr:HutP family protein [Roseospira marina]KAA5606139.1 transcriptional regulator [Roseospira marina]MBB4314278.1 hut operon positive regulator [Roseospira marina]MBB5087438.1 hut operon positive regulator [Roseospira marina]